MHFKVFAPIMVASALAACATEIKVPVTGQFAGQPAAGQATGSTDGSGSFWVQVPGGPRCSGAYNPYDSNPTIVERVSCTDGKTGEVVITRQLDGLSGTAIVTLSDGKQGQFVFGNIQFDQAFGDGGKASTAPLQRR